MFTIEDLISSLREETRIINHLYTKIPMPGGLEYKPNAYQRSMKELLWYMSSMGVMLSKMFKANGYNADDHDKSTPDLTQFTTIMDEQFVFVEHYLRSLSPDDLAREIDPFGMSMSFPVKHYVFNVLFKTYVAYRMQLFLYAKDAGSYTMGTSNLRMGRDMPDTM